MKSFIKLLLRIRMMTGTILLAAVLMGPSLASAQVSTLEAQVQSLLAQIAALQAAAPASASASASVQATASTMRASRTTPPTNIICPTFARTLLLGSSGSDVANLQGFLAQNPLIYPEGRVTAYFGMLTQDAVERWQSAYHIVSAGTPATTGYGLVGSRTATAMSASCASQTNGSPNQSTMTTDFTHQSLCPIASQPATPCAGTWSPLTNATGCTIAWQCAVPLPGYTAGQSSSTTTTSTSASCPTYTLPLCIDGVAQWLGMSSANCNLGYQCIHPGQ